jgi:DNA-binding MarR family transcriptional regulator
MSSSMTDEVDKVKQMAVGDPLDLMHALMHRIRSEQFQALREGSQGLTQMDARVLGFFGRHPQATLSDMAAHSGRDKAQLARLVAGLRERGLLHGEPDPQDRRSVRLSLTPQGQALQTALRETSRRLARKALAGFSAADKAQLQGLLLRMQANLASD